MKFYKDVEEEYYQMYVAKQQGHITEDKLKYFSEEKKKYEEIMALTPEKSGLSEQEIAQKQNNIRYPYAGFRRLMPSFNMWWATIPCAASMSRNSYMTPGMKRCSAAASQEAA